MLAGFFQNLAETELWKNSNDVNIVPVGLVGQHPKTRYWRTRYCSTEISCLDLLINQAGESGWSRFVFYHWCLPWIWVLYVALIIQFFLITDYVISARTKREHALWADSHSSKGQIWLSWKIGLLNVLHGLS